jgi:predicted nucleotidyltransferase
MSGYKQIFDSFSLRETLNPKVWEHPDDIDNATMIPKVRKGLEKIADEFIEYLGENVFVEDVVLTGSLANYNWSEFSDFDLHIVVDMSQYEGDADLYKELFNLKKQVFNDKHDIKIFGYDVELYAQDSKEVHYSSGVYSVMNNSWDNKPKKAKSEIDKEVLKKKIEHWVEKIDKTIESQDEDGPEPLNTIKEKLKDYRKSGLEKEGELSYENLVFKFLRRSGHIEKLFDSANKSLDKELSIEQQIEETL